MSSTGSGGALRVGVVLVIVLAIVGGGIAYYMGAFGHHAVAETNKKHEENAEEPSIRVKTVHSRYDKEFTVTVTRPADVQPYFSANLETMVPGYVTWIPWDVGSQVKKGEKLVEVLIPDRVARVDQRKADVKQAEAMVVLKTAAIDTAKADLESARAKVDAAQARLESDQAYEDFREKQKHRYEELYRQRAIDAKLVDEQVDRYEASKQATIASKAQLVFAKEEVKAYDARVQQAKADLEEAKSKVKVAEAELTYAKVMVDYGTIKAPFDGEITRRNVDPGFFVQNAGDGHALPLLVMQRNDIVTIEVRVPDVYVNYITPNTEAIFETSVMPGVKIHGKVTRYPQSLINVAKDRTMLVEIDLWNRDAAEFEKNIKNQAFREDLRRGLPDDPNKGYPVVPKFKGKMEPGKQKRLLPGTYGNLTLVLQKFSDVQMLPSQAVVRMGGYAYIYLVKDGKAVLQPVQVQIDDGKLAKVDLLSNEGEVLGSLTGQEEVIISNQSELADGQPVEPVLDKEWGKKKGVSGGDKNEKH